MKFNFPLTGILNRKGFVGSGPKRVSKVGTLANVRLGVSVHSSVAKARSVVWSENPHRSCPSESTRNITPTVKGLGVLQGRPLSSLRS